jgi:monoterpene epsilon-lactone hydrolase
MHLPRPLVVAMSVPVYRCALNHRVAPRWGRPILDASAVLLRVPAGTCVQHVTLGGRPAERVTVGASERPRAILYLHGGGYTIGSPRLYRALAAYLARSSGAVVYTLDYRLAPEHVYPAALDDAVAAFRDLVAVCGYPPGRIALAGDSAGGGLTVATARVLTDEGLRPAGFGLLSPWTDPVEEDMPVRRDRVTNVAWGRTSAAAYRGTADRSDPGYAPMYARLDGLPPMLIHCGVGEMLQEQITKFAARATSAGVEVQLVELPRLWHSGHVLAGMLREATDAVQDVGAFLRTQLDAVARVSV